MDFLASCFCFTFSPVCVSVCVYACTWLTDEICLARVDSVLQLVGGDAELILWRPVNSDGVVGGRAQLVSYGWRIGSYTWRKQDDLNILQVTIYMY